MHKDKPISNISRGFFQPEFFGASGLKKTPRFDEIEIQTQLGVH